MRENFDSRHKTFDTWDKIVILVTNFLAQWDKIVILATKFPAPWDKNVNHYTKFSTPWGKILIHDKKISTLRQNCESRHKFFGAVT